MDGMRVRDRALQIAVEREPGHLCAVWLDRAAMPTCVRDMDVGRRNRVGEKRVTVLHACVQDAHYGSVFSRSPKALPKVLHPLRLL